MSNAATWRERAERPAGGAFMRWARPALLVISILCALALAGRFIAEPLMRIRHVAVHSDVPLAEDQVLALSGIQAGEHWYTVGTAAIEKRLEASPLVRQARVERVFPDTVRLTVWGRQPVALLLAASGGRSLPVLVDGDGVIFRLGSTRGDLDLPVVSGITAGSLALGSRLPAAYRSLFADLRALKVKAPSLYAQLSEVRVVPINGGATLQTGGQDFDLLLYLSSSHVPALTRAALDDSVLKYTLMVVDLLSRQGILKDIQELDFRSGDVVYKLGSASTARSTDAAANARSTDAGKGG